MIADRRERRRPEARRRDRLRPASMTVAASSTTPSPKVSRSDRLNVVDRGARCAVRGAVAVRSAWLFRGLCPSQFASAMDERPLSHEPQRSVWQSAADALGGRDRYSRPSHLRYKADWVKMNLRRRTRRHHRQTPAPRRNLATARRLSRSPLPSLRGDESLVGYGRALPTPVRLSDVDARPRPPAGGAHGAPGASAPGRR
jgi:hypothetical protein